MTYKLYSICPVLSNNKGTKNLSYNEYCWTRTLWNGKLWQSVRFQIRANGYVISILSFNNSFCCLFLFDLSRIYSQSLWYSISASSNYIWICLCFLFKVILICLFGHILFTCFVLHFSEGARKWTAQNYWLVWVAL